jgi:hypothetical protein
MKQRLIFLFLMVFCFVPGVEAKNRFIHVEGQNLIQPDGSKFFIRGTNLGNWLNPEGYMFGFQKTNCEWMIDQMFRQLVGPDKTAEFWKQFKDNYITKEDISFIAHTGANTIRVPFNYKLFTDEDYMGLTSHQDGFARIDKVVDWCRQNHLYIILDMHDCPGGQTGDNIDDSYGYPWLFESARSAQLFCEIWQRIARHYRNETVILGYEFMNEPIAPFFNTSELNARLQEMQQRACRAIRQVDSHHVVLFGGAQWNSNFEPFSNWKFDRNMMFTCHRYGGGASAEAIRSFIDFRNKTGLPMYMGEIGHNTDEWQADFCKVMCENNIGYTFWPFKKVDSSCMLAFRRPPMWEELIVKFSEAPRTSFKEIRDARPAQTEAWRAMTDFLVSIRYANCQPQKTYIESMELKVP